MTKDNSKFQWQDGDVEILDKNGNPKPKTPEATHPEVNPDRSDRFTWTPDQIEILDSNGNPKK